MRFFLPVHCVRRRWPEVQRSTREGDNGFVAEVHSYVHRRSDDDFTYARVSWKMSEFGSLEKLAFRGDSPAALGKVHVRSSGIMKDRFGSLEKLAFRGDRRRHQTARPAFIRVLY